MRRIPRRNRSVGLSGFLPNHGGLGSYFRVGDKQSGILLLDPKALCLVTRPIRNYVERVPAPADNHSHVKLRRRVYAYTEPRKNSESYGIALTNAQKHNRIRQRTEYRTCFAGR
jgi:hypothetical protein